MLTSIPWAPALGTLVNEVSFDQTIPFAWRFLVSKDQISTERLADLVWKHSYTSQTEVGLLYYEVETVQPARDTIKNSLPDEWIPR